MNPAMFPNDAEMSTLGCAIIGGLPLLGDIRPVLPDPSKFYLPAHSHIYRAVLSLADSGTPIDILTVKEKLREQGHLEEVGGEDYIIQVCEFVPSARSGAHYAKIVEAGWERRDLADKARDLLRKAQDETAGLDEVRAAAARVDVSVKTGVGFGHFRDVDVSEPDLGVTTGFPKLDRAISTKGFPKSQMSVIRADHKGGKSTFMISSFALACEEGERCLYATFADLSDRQIKRRLLRNLSSWSRAPENLVDLANYKRAEDVINEYWEGHFFDASKTDSDVESFCSWLTSAHASKPFSRVYVDYAQELSSSDRKATNEVSEQNICASKLARLAARLEIPIIVGSQVTAGRDGGKAKTKYSRAWEEKAGWVLTLDREGDDSASVEITYSRFGPQGIRIPYRWNAKHLRFEELP